MHRLLKRQLKKVGYANYNTLTKEELKAFIKLVDHAYKDQDKDRALLENTLDTSSQEMQELYKRIKEQSERELERSEAKYDQLIESIKDHYFFFTHDQNGQVTYISDSATNILGYSKEEFLKNNYAKFLTDDPINKGFEESLSCSLQGQKQPPHDVSVHHKDGTVRYLEITGLPFCNKQGEIEGVEGIARDITSQYRAQNKISYLANHDLLTGISNRLNLEKNLEALISHSKRNKHKFAMLFMDLDHFKQINDTLGHDIGDRLLQKVVERIKPNIRKEDIFARIGGDEFIIVLTDIKEDDLLISVDKIMDLIHRPWNVESYKFNISASIGIALYPQDGETIIGLMKNADIAMYRAKELGRDNFCLFTPDLDDRIHIEMQLEQDMHYALEQKQFELYYQPKMHLDSNKIFGAEALVRWNHPTRGLIYPDQFIPLAEKTGFIFKLSSWIIEEACSAITRFNQITSQKPSLSVNISIRQFQQGSLCQVIEKAIKKSKISPEQFAIEITESIMFEERKSIINKLNRLKSTGITICVDDFGTGYSSLSFLHHLPIDTIKIDKSFIDEISEDENKESIVLDAIITMGKHLNMLLLAEGVEYEYQRQYLLERGCDFYQGYLFKKPLKENEYRSLISNR